MDKNMSSVDQITAFELSKLENSSKIQQLERELKRSEREIQEYKQKERQSVRAIVLYERKLEYIKKHLTSELEKLKDWIGDACEKSGGLENKEKEIDSLIEFISKETKTTTEEKGIVKNNNDRASIDERFRKLKSQFEEKIGTSVLRGRGRPNKEKQSIVADIGIGGNKSKVTNEKKKNQEKLDRLFFTASSGGAKAKSGVPQTDDSIFDFDEALNPELSLSDIMNDIENERKDLIEKKQMTKEQMLEAGYISKPRIKK